MTSSPPLITCSPSSADPLTSLPYPLRLTTSSPPPSQLFLYANYLTSYSPPPPLPPPPTSFASTLQILLMHLFLLKFSESTAFTSSASTILPVILTNTFLVLPFYSTSWSFFSSFTSFSLNFFSLCLLFLYLLLFYLPFFLLPYFPLLSFPPLPFSPLPFFYPLPYIPSLPPMYL